MVEAHVQAFRDLSASGRGIILPGASNALAARIAVDFGFKALHQTSAGLTNAPLSVPDLGSMELGQLVEHTMAVRNVVDLPLIVDSDTGFGNALNVPPAVRMLGRAAASAIRLEDRRTLKCCGPFSSKDGVSFATTFAERQQLAGKPAFDEMDRHPRFLGGRRMRAVQIDRYGGPEVVIRRELPMPSPGPGEVLIRLAWSGINFMDVHTRQGKYAQSRTYPQTMPTTLGIEGAGTIQALGDGVEGFHPGDRVAYCLSWGSYADYAVVAAWCVVPVPDALPLETAAASMFHGLTAHYLAYDLGRLGPGVTCLVHSASGGIGQLLLQIGAQLGATIYATTSTVAKAQVARERGASEAFLYEDGRFADRVRELTGGRGVDVVFDAIGKPTLRDSMRATRTRGLVVSFGSVGGNLKDLDPIELGEAGSLFLTRPRLADHLTDAQTIRRRAADIFAGLMQGALSILIAGRYTLDDVVHAHEELETRRTVGKPLLEIA